MSKDELTKRETKMTKMTDRHENLTVNEKKQIVYQFTKRTDLPINTVQLAHELGIDVYGADWKTDSAKISGLIRKAKIENNGNRFEILVNQKHPQTRRRFTRAHERAHFVLHEEYIGDGINDDALYRIGLPTKFEREANEYAAEILMPTHKLNYEISQTGINIEKLAKTFDVSKVAMSIRLKLAPDVTTQQD